MTERRPGDQTLELLSAIPYLAGLDIDILRELARAAVKHQYKAGQIMFLEGEPCQTLCLIEDGWLKATKLSPSGREQVISVLGPGQAFNAVGIFADAPCPATVIALEPATVWSIEGETVLSLVEEHPAVSRRILQSFAERVLHLVALVEDLSLRRVEARLARLLLEEAQKDAVQRHTWMTQAQMAARLGTVLDVLNRALTALAEEGLIQVSRQEILILDRQGLEAKVLAEA